MRFLIPLFTLCFLSSCVYHSGLITSTPELHPRSCEYVDIAVGYSKSSYFLGIGGFNKDAFLNEAKRNLYFSYPLRNGQSFENMTLDLKTSIIGPYKKVEAIVIADVVEGDTTLKVKYGKNYLDLLSKNNSPTFNFLSLNESIEFLDMDENEIVGKVIKLNKYSVTIFFVDNNGVLQIENRIYNAIFKFNNLEDLHTKVGFTKGDKVKFKRMESSTKARLTLEGTILGLNKKCALLKTPIGKLILNYDELEKSK